MRNDSAIVAPPNVTRSASLELLVGIDAVVAVVAIVLLVDEGVEPFKRMALRWNPSSVSELLSLILMPPTPPWAQVL